MVKSTEFARPLLGCALWSLSLVAAAQGSTQPENQAAPRQRSAQGAVVLQVMPDPSVQPAESEKPANSADSGNQVTSSFFVSDSADFDDFQKEVKERQAKLRAELADPKQRAQIMATRLQLQRMRNPELAASLKLDQRLEDKLLALLADQELSQELVPHQSRTLFSNDGTGNARASNPLSGEAARYTQRMAEIGQLIGASRLDDYVDYELQQGARSWVREFDQLLPVGSKLTLEQRNSLTDLFHQHPQSTSYQDSPLGPLFSSYDKRMSQEELDRYVRLYDIAVRERRLEIQEATDREVVDQAASILTPEQLKALTDWKQQQLSQQRDRVRDQRRALRIGPEEEQALSNQQIPASPPISKNLRLSIDLMVNDTQVVKELTSVKGGSVSFDAREGLLMEVRPYMQQQQLMAEVSFYEKARNGRRLLGRTVHTAGNSSQKGSTTIQMLRGRKGYSVVASLSGTYL